MLITECNVLSSCNVSLCSDLSSESGGPWPKTLVLAWWELEAKWCGEGEGDEDEDAVGGSCPAPAAAAAAAAAATMCILAALAEEGPPPPPGETM